MRTPEVWDHRAATQALEGERDRPPPALAPALRAGEVLAGRFRIVEFLGEGAIGEVYEAEDLELGGRLAVKTLHPAIAADQRALLRFKREIQTARQVTHPNVCRIFDLFRHTPALRRRASDRDGGVVFLTMEMLRGEPLSARLARCGAMVEAEALPIALQVAAALAAAHAAGIVHRDVKSGNVMLVETAAGTRAVVTDFGLARSSTAPSSLTGTGTLVGSPAYMSPEQVAGDEVTAASDIYSFGVVLYEMVTGTLPFPGETAFRVALRRLDEPPPSPRAAAPGLDRRWEAAILGCLERDPRRRWGSAAEVAAALAGAREGGRPRRLGAWRLAARATLARLPILGLLALTLLPDRVAGLPPLGSARVPRVPPAPATLAAAPPRRAAVAVLGFQDLSRDAVMGYLGTALREMLASDLARGGTLRVVSSEDVERLRRDLALTVMRSLATATLRQVRRASGADLVVTGTYLLVPGPPAGAAFRLDVTVQDAASGATVATLSQTGSVQAILPTLDLIGAELLHVLGAPAPPDGEAEQRQVAQSPARPRAIADTLTASLANRP